MFRRLTVLLALLLVLSLSSWAAESEPSNTVGFISFTSTHGFWRPFAFPFTYYDANHTVTTSISNIVVGNFVGNNNPAFADWIYDQFNGLFCYKNTNGVWSGPLTNIVPGHAYFVRVVNTNPDVNVITAGEVDMTAVDLGTMTSGLWNPVGVRDPGQVPLSNSCLLESGFTGGNILTSDWLYEQNSGHFAYYNTSTNSWAGELTQLTPGYAYYVKVAAGHNTFTWNYTPSGVSGLDLVFQPQTTPVQPPVNNKVLRIYNANSSVNESNK